ncbi:MAG: hypothetical protein OK455_10920 [Thaumarchaeota archaeon]|nr:hypothetical protein [Nitrososphaerota archaeon]
MAERRVTVRLSGPKGSLDVRMVIDPNSSLTRIPRSLANEIGVTKIGRIELDGETRTIPLSIVANGEGNCPALGLTAVESLGLKVGRLSKK